MELIPTQDEVAGLLRSTGGLRGGHFEYPNGLHVSEYLQVALTMNHFQTAKTLSVGLSRLLRGNSDIRAMLPKVSIVAPATGGLPVAYGVSEALRTEKVYWAERRNAGDPLAFRQFLELEKGERCILVDDIFRTGTRLSELKQLVESAGGQVVAIAVMVYQPHPDHARFEGLPFYYLARLDGTFVTPDQCPQCREGIPAVKVYA